MTTVRTRVAAVLPAWTRSLRFRMTLLYSSVLFGLAAVLLAALYLGLSLSLRDEPLSREAAVVQVVDGNGEIPEGQTFIDGRAFEEKVNAHALESLRRFSLGALGALFVASLAVGWVIAGRALRPIDRITAVARDIHASDLSRRIELAGPDDELKRLADTFDAMLERLDDAFTAQRRFLADASHELRNPLAIIRTNSELDVDAPREDGDSPRRMNRIRRAADRMTKLVDDLLTLARLDAPEVTRERVDLGTLVSEAGDEFVADARARGLTLEWAPPPNVVVRADRTGLKRAVVNLLDNAVRLAPTGTRVRLAGGRENGWAWLAVADEGPGIAPEHQQRIFDRFYRVDKGRSRGAGGSGLGLSIVRDVVAAQGGAVRLHSEPGRGSTFVIWLPAGTGHREPPVRSPV